MIPPDALSAEMARLVMVRDILARQIALRRRALDGCRPAAPVNARDVLARDLTDHHQAHRRVVAAIEAERRRCLTALDHPSTQEGHD